MVASISSPQIPAPGSPGCLLALSPDTLYIAFELEKGGFVGRVGLWLLPNFSEGTEQWSAEAGWEFTPASEFIITEQVSQESPRAAWLNHRCAVSRSQEDVWGARWKPRVDVRKTAGGVIALRSVLPDVAGTFRLSSTKAFSPHYFQVSVSLSISFFPIAATEHHEQCSF